MAFAGPGLQSFAHVAGRVGAGACIAALSCGQCDSWDGITDGNLLARHS